MGEVECDRGAPEAGADAIVAEEGERVDGLVVEGAAAAPAEELEPAERAGSSIGDGAAELDREEGMEGGTEGADADDAGVTAVAEAGESGAGLPPLRLDCEDRGVLPADPARDSARSRYASRLEGRGLSTDSETETGAGAVEGVRADPGDGDRGKKCAAEGAARGGDGVDIGEG